jgi:hypothetical protein
MKKLAVLLSSILFILSISGCMVTPLTRDYKNVAEHFRSDVLNFYDSISDAYFILGYEYYELSKEFEKKGNVEQAAYYGDKATIYYNLSKDMKNAASETMRFARENQK